MATQSRRRRNPWIDPTKEIAYEHQLADDSQALSLAYLNHSTYDSDVFELVAALEEENGCPLHQSHPWNQS